MIASLRNLVLVSSLVAAPLALGPRVAEAAVDAFLTVKGQKQGDMKGSVTQKGQEGTIRVLAVRHEIVSPRDAASGQATGQRTHKPLEVVLELDSASPLLIQALVTNERLANATLTFVKRSKRGTAETYYQIKLTDAFITSYKIKPADEGPEESPATLTIGVVYKKIEWTWIDGGITASDDWETPVAAAGPRKPGK